MKKTILMAAMLVLAACGEKKADTGATTADTAAMAPTMTTDTAMGMSHDSTAMSSDSTMARDTTK